MKKETLIAIILGITAGIGIAFFLVQQSGNSPKNNNVILDKITPTISIDTSEVEPLIIQSPESEFVTDKSSMELTIAVQKNSFVVIQSIIEEFVYKNTSKTTTKEIKLVPGENIIKVTAYNDKNIDTRTLVVYSMTSSLGSNSVDTKATETNKSNQKKTNEDSTINALKEKIEKKVDELNQGNKNIVAGKITELKDNSMTVTADSGKDYTVAIDDTITEIYQVILDEKDVLEFQDLRKSDRVVISGPSIENQISANIIYLQTSYLVTYGQVVNTDSSAFTIDVVTSNKEQLTLDVEEDTTQRMLNSDTLELKKSGFSKIKNGDTIFFSTVQPAENAKKASALRILVIAQEFLEQEKTPTPKK